MIKTILTTLALMTGLLFISVNVCTAGDLAVTGKLGVGTTSPTAPLTIVGSDETVVTGSPTLTQAITRTMFQWKPEATGTGYDPRMTGMMIQPSTKVTNMVGGNSFLAGVKMNSDYAGSGILDTMAAFTTNVRANTGNAGTNIVSSSAGTTINLLRASANTEDVEFTDFKAILTQSTSAGGGSGNISGTNWYHHYMEDFTDLGGTVANVHGLYIEQQTRGSNNYGIVLSGDGAGSDIVFGSGQEARIYSEKSGADTFLYADDSGGNHTRISPHDPETGEWVYYSKNLKTGVVKQVNMEALIKDIEKLTGKKYLIETVESVQ